MEYNSILQLSILFLITAHPLRHLSSGQQLNMHNMEKVEAKLKQYIRYQATILPPWSIQATQLQKNK